METSRRKNVGPQGPQPQVWRTRPMVSACPRIYVSTYKFTASSDKQFGHKPLILMEGLVVWICGKRWEKGQKEKMTQEIKYYQMCCDAATWPAAAVPHFCHYQFKIQSKPFFFSSPEFQLLLLLLLLLLVIFERVFIMVCKRVSCCYSFSSLAAASREAVFFKNPWMCLVTSEPRAFNCGRKVNISSSKSSRKSSGSLPVFMMSERCHVIPWFTLNRNCSIAAADWNDKAIVSLVQGVKMHRDW